MRNSQPNQNNGLFGEIIYAYTRSQALADGKLVDVSEQARQVGFRFPGRAYTVTVERDRIHPGALQT